MFWGGGGRGEGRGGIPMVKKKLPGAKFLIFLVEQQHYVSCSRKYIRLVKCNKLQSQKLAPRMHVARKNILLLTLAITMVKCIDSGQANTFFFHFKDLK